MALPAATVVPPPPSVPAWKAPALPMPDTAVVPPPPSLTHTQALRGMAVGRAEIVPPPPSAQVHSVRSVNSGDFTVQPPPAVTRFANSESAAAVSSRPESVWPAAEVVVSTHAGDGVGLPVGRPGSVSMSPAGSKQPIAGTVPGPEPMAGMSRGTPNSAAVGTGTSGDGLGADKKARGGLGLQSGPGGAGTGNGDQLASGVAISGGVVHLSSFGGAATPSSKPAMAPAFAGARSTGLVVIASARAGGGLSRYLAQSGRVYTIYLATRIGTAVLQYADATKDTAFGPDLVPPQPIDVDLPTDLQHGRVVLSATIDRDGVLRRVQVLEADKPDFASRLIAALQRWKFRPVFRRDAAVEVSAVLGFGLQK